jgi:hypothetical protein
MTEKEMFAGLPYSEQPQAIGMTENPYIEICDCKKCEGDCCSDYAKITRAYQAGIKKALEEVEKELLIPGWATERQTFLTGKYLSLKSKLLGEV